MAARFLGDLGHLENLYRAVTAGLTAHFL